jgi:hypothetical protein
VEELPRSMIHPDKDPPDSNLVDDPDLERWRMLYFIRHQNCRSRNAEFTDQQSIVLHLNSKGWTTRAIHDDLVAILCEEASAYRTMMKYLRETRISHGNTTTLSDSTSPLIGDEARISLWKNPVLFSAAAFTCNTSTSNHGIKATL